MVDVIGQVEAAALLATLDEHHAARMRQVLLLQGANRRQGAEYGITVVGAAAAVELAIPDHGFPRGQTVTPAIELGLLVQVAVEQDGVVVAAFDLAEKHRRAAGQPDDVHRHALDGLLTTPLGEELRRLVHVAVFLPVRIEAG